MKCSRQNEDQLNKGDLLRVKYTGETIVVLNTSMAPDFLVCRRAKQTTNGIEYVETSFHASELEPVEANIDREFQEGLYRRDQMLRLEEREVAKAAPKDLGSVN